MIWKTAAYVKAKQIIHYKLFKRYGFCEIWDKEEITAALFAVKTEIILYDMLYAYTYGIHEIGN